MSYKKTVCGLDPQATYRLHRRYQYLREHNWGSFEEFAQWAIDSGGWRGAFLRKKNEELPHGPDNSYWSEQPSGSRSWDKAEAIKSDYCKGCARDNDLGCGGCENWREYFVKNWNEKIHVDLSANGVVSDIGSRMFCYEHPDLIREGIV